MSQISLCPPHIQPHHWQEWVVGSRVDPTLAALNLQTLSNGTAYDYLLYSDKLPRRNDGRLTRGFLTGYRHLELGGWWCSGVDLLAPTLEPSLWGCFKPDSPRLSAARGKQIKYEHPPKTDTEIFALQVPQPIWSQIAARCERDWSRSTPVPRTQERYQSGSFWQWVLETPQVPLLITEGAKKAGSLLTAGYAAIALPGIYNGYRQPRDERGYQVGPPQLIPQLEVLAREGREVIFCFDRDSKPKTIANVNQAIAKTGKLLQQQGCKVSVITWSYPEKGVDDLIAARGVECFYALYQSRMGLEEYQFLQRQELSSYVNHRVERRYLSSTVSTPTATSDSQPSPDSPRDDLAVPADAQLVGLKSAKGTGKTEWLTGVVEAASAEGRRVLVLSHREQLAMALGDRFGIDYRTQLRTSPTRGVLGYSLCVDSLHPTANPPFNPQHWSGAVVIIDEVEQMLWHLLDSNTCLTYRVEILKCFKELLQTVASTDGRLYIADADLSPIALKYLQQLSGQPVSTWVVENKYNPNRGRRQLYTYEGRDPAALVAALVKAIDEGERPLVVTGAQKLKSRWSTQTLEAYLNQRFPQARSLRIDSESVADPEHPAYGCMGRLDELLPEYDIVIASPTIETGVSIDLRGHLTSVWGLASGVQTVEAVCQSLERVREDVPRHLWAAERGLNRVGNGATTFKALLASQHKLCRANIQLLTVADAEDEFDALDTDFQPESLQTWAKRACLVNLGMKHYRELIYKKLMREGYELIPQSPTAPAARQQSGEVTPDGVKAEVKKTQQENYQHHCRQVATLATPSETELAALERQQAKTRKERQRELKGRLVRRYGELSVTPELVAKDEAGWYAKLRRHYFLTVGAEFSSARERHGLLEMMAAGAGAVFKPDLNRRMRGAMQKTLEIIDLKQFLDPEREFSSESLKDWQEVLTQQRYDLKTLTGISISPDRDETPIQLAQRLLTQLLGLKLQYLGKRGERGKQIRVYGGCVPDPDGRGKIFQFWLERDRSRLAGKVRDGTYSVPEPNVTNDTVVTLSINTQINTEKMATEVKSQPSAAAEITQPEKQQQSPPGSWTPRVGEIVAVYNPLEPKNQWGSRGLIRQIARHASDCWEVLVDGVVRQIWSRDWLFPAPDSS